MMFYNFGNGSQELSLHQKLPTPKQLYFYILWIGCMIIFCSIFPHFLNLTKLRFATVAICRTAGKSILERKEKSISSCRKSLYFTKIFGDFSSDANSAVNPLIYALHHSEFKQVTVQLEDCQPKKIFSTSGVHWVLACNHLLFLLLSPKVIHLSDQHHTNRISIVSQRGDVNWTRVPRDEGDKFDLPNHRVKKKTTICGGKQISVSLFRTAPVSLETNQGD